MMSLQTSHDAGMAPSPSCQLPSSHHGPNIQYDHHTAASSLPSARQAGPAHHRCSHCPACAAQTPHHSMGYIPQHRTLCALLALYLVGPAAACSHLILSSLQGSAYPDQVSPSSQHPAELPHQQLPMLCCLSILSSCCPLIPHPQIALIASTASFTSCLFINCPNGPPCTPPPPCLTAGQVVSARTLDFFLYGGLTVGRVACTTSSTSGTQKGALACGGAHA